MNCFKRIICIIILILLNSTAIFSNEKDSKNETADKLNLVEKSKIEKIQILNLFLGKRPYKESSKDKSEDDSKKESLSLKENLNQFNIQSILEFIKDYQIPILKSQTLTKEKLIEELISKSTSFKKDLKSEKDSFNLKDLQDLNIVSEISKLEKFFDSGFLGFKADEIYLSQKKDEKGFRYIHLFGNIRLEIAENILYSDEMFLKVAQDFKIIEIISHNEFLIILSDKTKVVGRKLIIYPQQEQGEIFLVKGYQKPYFIKSKKVIQVNRYKYVFHDGNLTTSNLKDPFFLLEFDKAWFYNKQFLSVQNIILKIGDTPLAWLPFFYLSKNRTLWRTSLGNEKGLGWFINNSFFYIYDKDLEETMSKTAKKTTINQVTDEFSLGLFLDFYQKLGPYGGIEIYYPFYKGMRLYAKGGIAYDRFIIQRQVRAPWEKEIFTNYFLGNENKYTEVNNLRWNFELESNIKIFSSSIFENSINLVYQRISDGSFKNQFESQRKTHFDLYEQLNLEESKSSFLSQSLNEYSNAQKFKLEYSQNLYKLFFNIKVDLNYKGVKKKLSYFVKDFILEKDSFTLPSLDLKYSNYFNIIGETKLKEKEEEKTKEEDENLKKLIFEVEGEEKKTETQNESDYTVVENELLFQETETEDILKLKMPFKYNFNFNFSKTRYHNNDILETDIEKNSLQGTINTPFDLSYQFLVFTISPELTFKNIFQKTVFSNKNEEEQKRIDEKNSYPSWKSSLTNQIVFTFLEEYEYLTIKLKGDSTLSYSGLFKLPVKKPNSNEYENLNEWAQQVTYSGSFSFLKTTFSISSGEDLYINPIEKDQISEGKKSESEIMKEKKFNLNINSSSDLIPYVNASHSVSYSRKDEEWIDSNLSVTLKIINPIHKNIFILNNLNVSTSWNKNFLSPYSDKLSFSFTLDIIIKDLFQFIFTSKSYNNQLYLYDEQTAFDFGEEKRNFFQDILDSLNLASPKKRSMSAFKLETLSFIFRHDLHDWMFQFRLDLNIKNIQNKYYYFEPTIVFDLYLKNLFSIRFPQYKKSWSRQ